MTCLTSMVWSVSAPGTYGPPSPMVWPGVRMQSPALECRVQTSSAEPRHPIGGRRGGGPQTLDPYWGHIGVILGSSWGHRGVILGSSWGHLGSSWGHIGVILGSSWGHPATSQPPIQPPNPKPHHPKPKYPSQLPDLYTFSQVN